MRLVIDLSAGIVKEGMVDSLEHCHVRALADRAEVGLQLTGCGGWHKFVVFSKKPQDRCPERLQVGTHVRMDTIEHDTGTN